ncbi:class I SAM-dependent methyltransferase [Agarivorans gilvus]|uniref:Ribosomal RNA small subunit methyltransferase J n=1 Tax=Agarivorans gilvus TaxID=680279 RepID=A0ABQ1I1C7_9ALTE|nr:ribosomal RNA small subunit methyltransferase J [Agarivorans gilvus]
MSAEAPRLYCLPDADLSYAELLQQRFAMQGVVDLPTSGFCLLLDSEGLSLRWCDEAKLGAVKVDFLSGKAAHRRHYGGAEAVSKAVGVKKGQRPSVIDATAGLGRDAFVLANLGCQVTMFERSPWVAALLEDGLNRAKADPEIGEWVAQRMKLVHANSISDIQQHQLQAEVVYLDPMYPHRKKSAQVKKEMRIFQQLVGADADADKLLQQALQIATRRVVVKRPSSAAPLAGKAAANQLNTKTHRFDIYSLI